jgi:hypothetical protein
MYCPASVGDDCEYTGNYKHPQMTKIERGVLLETRKTFNQKPFFEIFNFSSITLRRSSV